MTATATLSVADYVWVEGESSTRHTMRQHSWYDSVTRDSVTGELEWDYGVGLATINASKAQGAAGFLVTRLR